MPRIQVNIAREEREDKDDPLILVVGDEEFVCQSEMSEFALLDLASSASAQTVSDIIESASVFMRFMEDILEPESWSRLKAKAIKEKWKAEDMLPFVQVAVEHLYGRPTQPPSESPVSEPTIGTPSKVVSLSEGGATEAS